MKKLITFLFTILVGTLMVVTPVLAVNTYSVDLEASSTQYLSITNGDQTGLNWSTRDFTMETWVRFESKQDYQVIYSKKTGGATKTGIRWNFAGGASNRHEVWLGNGSTDVTNSTIDWTPSLETWYHLVLTYTTSSGDLSIYVATAGGSHSLIDVTASGVLTGVVGDNVTTMAIGYDIAGYYPWDGEIDDFRIWSDLRTTAEMDANFETEIAGDATGLVSYWKFNNDGTDTNSNGNDLTNNNSATFSSDVPFVGASPAIIPKRAGIIIEF